MLSAKASLKVIKINFQDCFNLTPLKHFPYQDDELQRTLSHLSQNVCFPFRHKLLAKIHRLEGLSPLWSENACI